MPEVAVLAAGRSAFTGRSRAQAGRTDDQLAGPLLAGLTAAAGISSPERAADGVILGSCTGPGGNVGRRAALAAGFGLDCPGWSVDAQCGSGMLAVQQAADRIRLDGGLIAAGGVESPSTAPERRIDGVAYRQAPMVPRGFTDPDLVHAAEDLARVRGITRQRQDALAERSHRLALEHADLLAAERLDGSGIADDGPRAVTARLLARFAPLVPEAAEPGTPSGGASPRHTDSLPETGITGEPRPGFGSVTPGNTARIVDGAAALLLGPAPRGVDGQPARPHTLVRAGILAGGDPALPGAAPTGALRRLLRRAGIGLDRLGALEIVEAFSAQVLATLDDLDLADGERIDPRVNAAGGALALGHPWGASGAAVLVRLHHRLLACPPGTLGAAACAIGGGMAAAVLLQRGD